MIVYRKFSRKLYFMLIGIDFFFDRIDGNRAVELTLDGRLGYI